MEPRLIFISHAAADRPIAETLAARLEACGPGVKTFVASRAGDIRADAEWVPSVQTALRESDAYVILLTPNSVLRPWVSFETGAAWFSEKACVLVRVGDLTAGEVPLPLSGKQLYSLADVHEAGAVFATLGLTLTSPEEFLGKIAHAVSTAALAGEQEPSWEGLELGGAYYAWAGPLLALEDKASIPCPPGLLDAMRSRGLAVRWGNRDRLTDHYGKGRAQVFATDKSHWRRAVANGSQLLLVARREDPHE